MCGMPWAVRLIVAPAASALAGTTRHASTAAVTALHPLTARNRIGAFSLGAPVGVAQTPSRGLLPLQGRERAERFAALRHVLQVRGQRSHLRRARDRRAVVPDPVA